MSYTKTPITATQAASILGLSPKTLYNGGAGTEGLTRLRTPGSRTVRFIRQEVEKFFERMQKDKTRRGYLYIFQMTIPGYELRPLTCVYGNSEDKALQTINAPFALDFVARWRVKGPKAVQQLEMRFAAYKMDGGGWFRPHSEVVTYISEKDQDHIQQHWTNALPE